MVAIDMYEKNLRKWIYGCRMSFIFYYFTLFIFHYFLFIFMFPFCLDTTSALNKPITIFFCIIKRFWIFDMFLKFLYVLDVNKNKFYCNIFICDSCSDLVPSALAYLAVFYLGYLKGMVLHHRWRVILVFYHLVFYCIILRCSVCLYFVFLLLVTEVFGKPSEENSP